MKPSIFTPDLSGKEQTRAGMSVKSKRLNVPQLQPQPTDRQPRVPPMSLKLKKGYKQRTRELTLNNGFAG